MTNNEYPVLLNKSLSLVDSTIITSHGHQENQIIGLGQALTDINNEIDNGVKTDSLDNLYNFVYPTGAVVMHNPPDPDSNYLSSWVKIADQSNFNFNIGNFSMLANIKQIKNINLRDVGSASNSSLEVNSYNITTTGDNFVYLPKDNSLMEAIYKSIYTSSEPPTISTGTMTIEMNSVWSSDVTFNSNPTFRYVSGSIFTEGTPGFTYTNSGSSISVSIDSDNYQQGNVPFLNFCEITCTYDNQHASYNYTTNYRTISALGVFAYTQESLDIHEWCFKNFTEVPMILSNTTTNSSAETFNISSIPITKISKTMFYADNNPTLFINLRNIICDKYVFNKILNIANTNIGSGSNKNKSFANIGYMKYLNNQGTNVYTTINVRYVDDDDIVASNTTSGMQKVVSSDMLEPFFLMSTNSENPAENENTYKTIQCIETDYVINSPDDIYNDNDTNTQPFIVYTFRISPYDLSCGYCRYGPYLYVSGTDCAGESIKAVTTYDKSIAVTEPPIISFYIKNYTNNEITTINFTSLDNLFSYMNVTNILDYIQNNTWTTTNVTSMAGLFKNSTATIDSNTLDLSNLDFTNVKNFSQMLQGWSSITTIDFGTKTPSVGDNINFINMLQGCDSLKSIKCTEAFFNLLGSGNTGIDFSKWTYDGVTSSATINTTPANDETEIEAQLLP